MTLSIILQFAVVLAAIWMGARSLGVGLGLWGAVGLLVLIVAFGVNPTSPPIDVMLHDPGPALVAIGQDLVEAFPVEKSTYYKDLIAEAQEPMGPAPFFQVVGLTYNPDTIKTPPTSWADLWKP